MMRPLFGTPRGLATLLFVTALVVAFAAACSKGGASPAGAPGRGVYIGAIWHGSRSVTGHQVHVLRKRIACSQCHELTGDSIGEVKPERCAGCHEKEARIEHAAPEAQQRFGAATKADCTNCHAFTVTGVGHASTDGQPHGPTECRRCHVTQQGSVPGVKVHGEAACVTCHKPHEDAKPVPAPCGDCHKDVKTTHGAGVMSGTAVCTACHQHQHAPAAEARPTCASCHATQKPVIPATALFAEGHRECVGCHRPHQFDKAAAVSCRSCHEDIGVLGGARVKPHNQCTNCHAPHDVRGTAERACAACHRDKHPDHPRRGEVGTCVGCHDPHPRGTRALARARSCSSCHQVAANDKSFHGGTACSQCHKPHDFVREVAGRAVCQSCHSKQLGLVATAKGHQACEGCHSGLPHRPSALGVGCDACHAAERADATRGHAKCTGCHEPHGGSQATQCRSCHQEEQKTAPAGHQVCVSCHQPHSGTPKAGCASCHANEAKTHHGEAPQGCATCHRPHGPGGIPKPPACATCHQVSALPGLHQMNKHQECMRCHTGHGEPAANSERNACLTCHADRKNHFPDAPRCANCHLFNAKR